MNALGSAAQNQMITENNPQQQQPQHRNHNHNKQMVMNALGGATTKPPQSQPQHYSIA